MAGVAAHRADGRVVHRIGREAARCIRVAVAALGRGCRNVRRRRKPLRSQAVVAIGADGVSCKVGVGGAGPTYIAANLRTGMAGRTVAPAGRDVACIDVRPQGAACCALARECTVVAGVAARRRDGRVARRAHPRIARGDGEAGPCVAVAVAALDAADEYMRRRSVARRGNPVVAARTICVRRRVGEGRPRPADVAPARSRRMAGQAVRAVGCNMTGIVRRSVGAVHALGRKCAAVAGAAGQGADGGMAGGAHAGIARRPGKACSCVDVAIAALNAAAGNMRRLRHASRRRSVVTA